MSLISCCRTSSLCLQPMPNAKCKKQRKKTKRCLSACKTFEIYKNRYLSSCKAEVSYSLLLL
jgi:hypothetical protein